MRLLFILMFGVLAIGGCAARKLSMESPGPQYILAASKQPARPLVELVAIYKPAVVLSKNEKYPINAAAYLKMGDSKTWHGYVFLPDHTFGYLRCDLESKATGAVELKRIWTPIGRWE